MASLVGCLVGWLAFWVCCLFASCGLVTLCDACLLADSNNFIGFLHYLLHFLLFCVFLQRDGLGEESASHPPCLHLCKHGCIKVVVVVVVTRSDGTLCFSKSNTEAIWAAQGKKWAATIDNFRSNFD